MAVARARDFKKPAKQLSPRVLAALQNYPWPGSVRELRNVIERLVILSPDDTIDEPDVRTCLGAGSVPKGALYRPGVPFKLLLYVRPSQVQVTLIGSDHEKEMVEALGASGRAKGAHANRAGGGTSWYPDASASALSAIVSAYKL